MKYKIHIQLIIKENTYMYIRDPGIYFTPANNVLCIVLQIILLKL